MKITIVAAAARNGVIGDKNTIPWMGKFPQDMRHFKNLTQGPGKAVLMGRNTWESMGGKPLRGRINLVLTGNQTYPMDRYAVRVSNHAEAIRWCERRGMSDLFIIGGAGVFKEALTYADNIVLTVIDREFRGDTKMPAIDQSQFRAWAVESGENEHFSYRFEYWNRVGKTESVPCLPE